MRKWTIRDFNNRQRYYLSRQSQFYKANMRAWRQEALRTPTRAENDVMEYLKANKKEFEFQRIIAINEDKSYRVDFFFPKIMTVLEIDGEYHYDNKQQKLDKEREDYIKRMGIKIERINNYDVYAKRFPKFFQYI